MLLRQMNNYSDSVFSRRENNINVIVTLRLVTMKFILFSRQAKKALTEKGINQIVHSS